MVYVQMGLQHVCEQEYLLYQAGQRDAVMSVSTRDNQQLCIDFQDMRLYTATGLHSDMEVCRRPLYVGTADSDPLTGSVVGT